jgi:hypothetical protein
MAKKKKKKTHGIADSRSFMDRFGTLTGTCLIVVIFSVSLEVNIGEYRKWEEERENDRSLNKLLGRQGYSRG